MTSLLRALSKEEGIPLSTLKLNARILRDLNLISYGSTGEIKCAEVKVLGTFVLNLLIGETKGTTIRFSNLGDGPAVPVRASPSRSRRRDGRLSPSGS